MLRLAALNNTRHQTGLNERNRLCNKEPQGCEEMDSFLKSSLLFCKTFYRTIVLVAVCLSACVDQVQCVTRSSWFHPQDTGKAETSGASKVLEPGQSIEREIAADHKHQYQITLAEGQYADVRVEQRGVDIIAHLFAADGQLIADIDEEATAQGSERVELVAEAAGSYKIEIETSLPKASPGWYAIQLTELRAPTADERLLFETLKQYYLSLRLGASGKIDKAIELGNRALETRQRVRGPVHPLVAASLRSLGWQYGAKNDLARAESVFQQAEEVTAKTSGTDSLEYADVLFGLGETKLFKGDLARSELPLQRSLSIREKIAGPESRVVASSLLMLALFYRYSNDLPRAEQSYLRALAIREKLLGTDHIGVSNVLSDLGLFYYGAGDYKDAEPFLQRALTIREKVSPNHEQVGRISNNLGLLEWKKRNYDKAEAYFRRAMDVFERTSGPESSWFAGSLCNLGIIYKEGHHNYAKAEECYLRALAIYDKVLGKESSNSATTVLSLGILYRAMGDHERAEQFCLRALSINERLLGPDNRETIRCLISLAQLYALKGDIGRSIEYQRRISESEEKTIRLNLTLGSERQKLAYFTQLENPDRVISLHVGLAPDNAIARDLAAATVLRQKGRVLDALSESLSALRGRLDPNDRALLDSLSEINSKLSGVVLSGPQKKSVGERQNQIETLEGEREKLEAEINRRSAGFYQVSRPITLAAVQGVIPHDAALVEFAVYHPFDWKAASDQSSDGEPRYVVYVMRDQGEVRWAELGATKDVDTAIHDFRDALRDPQRKDVQQLARLVDKRVMQPVRALTGDAKQLLVSPDGELNLLPFAALVDERGHYLVETYAVTYLTSGRDLLRMQVARNSQSPPVVVADPAFGDPPVIAAREAADRATPAAGGRVQFDYSQIFFGPLPGVNDEVRALRELLPNARFLTRERATKTALQSVSAPSILHIATHGFFLQVSPGANEESGAAAPSSDATRMVKWSTQATNPLLRSGLALAGANQSGDGKDNGILTALEASGLNLWGTKLVVLSACNTGLGEVRNGDGVYGLRRAFVLAGAESQLMSLWPVSDRSTRDLMVGYYKSLVQGRGRGEALRLVQLQMAQGKTRVHPYYWASFIQTGEWANLEGRR